MGAALAYSAYRRSEIDTLSPRDLVVKMYEGLERFIEAAAVGIEGRRYEAVSNNARRSRDILFELQSTLNFEAGGEIAKRLNEIYDFLTREVIEASLTKDAGRMRKLLRVVGPLTEAWKGIPSEHANITSLTGDDRSHIINMCG